MSRDLFDDAIREELAINIASAFERYVGVLDISFLSEKNSTSRGTITFTISNPTWYGKKVSALPPCVIFLDGESIANFTFKGLSDYAAINRMEGREIEIAGWKFRIHGNDHGALSDSTDTMILDILSDDLKVTLTTVLPPVEFQSNRNHEYVEARQKIFDKIANAVQGLLVVNGEVVRPPPLLPLAPPPADDDDQIPF